MTEGAPQKKTEAVTLSQEEIEIRGEQYIALTPHFPTDFSAQGKRKAENAALSGFDYVGDVDDTEEEIVNDIQGLTYEAGGVAKDEAVSRVEEDDGRWLVNQKMPKTLQRIFAQALAHELMLHPTHLRENARLSLRLVKPENKPAWETNQNIHFDSEANAPISSYLIAGAPGTVQYLPSTPTSRKNTYISSQYYNKPGEEWLKNEGEEQGIVASSILPMKLYHFDQTALHSLPWTLLAPVKEGEAEKPRFFFRIEFTP